MKQAKKSRRVQFCTAITAFVVGTLLYVVYVYHDTRSNLLEEVDDKLRIATYAVTTLLGEDFHANLNNEQSISFERDYEIAQSLTKFVRDIDLAYAYSMIMVDNKIIFASSSATKEELANNAYEKAYYTGYPEADQAIFETFAKQATHVSEYEDRWGRFRSVFMPFTASDGRLYVIGADVEINNIDAISRQSALYAFFVSLFIGIIGFPLIYSLIKSIRREARAEIFHLYTDTLTELPNRSKLLKDLEKTQHPILGVINIDHFREVTNTYGTAVGDNVIVQFANKLQCFHHPDLENYRVYRLHGDEFAALVDQSLSKTKLQIIFKEFYTYLTQAEFDVSTDKKIKLNVNIGGVSGEEDALTFADMAMRQAKENNKSVVIYDQELRLPEMYQRNLAQISELRRALAEDRVVPFFQPLLNAHTNTVDKYEVLARIVDDEGQVVQLPCDFLPISYRSRLYRHITVRMLSKALDEIKGTPYGISMNISVRDVNNLATKESIISLLKKSGLAHRVQFELLESEGLGDHRQLMKFFLRLRRLGCRLGIDDLGKEYSNFDRLIKLPINFIKIDGEVMNHIAEDDEVQSLVKDIVAFAKDKGLETIAEQCSSEAICDVAKFLGVDYLQGFFISKPTAHLQPVQGLSNHIIHQAAV